jgi:hypothetical protein
VTSYRSAMTSPTSQFSGADSLMWIQTQRHEVTKGENKFITPHPTLSSQEERRIAVVARRRFTHREPSSVVRRASSVIRASSRVQGGVVYSAPQPSLLTLPSPLKRRGESPSSRLPGVRDGLSAHRRDQVSGSSFIITRRAFAIRPSPGSDRVTFFIGTILRRRLRLSTCIVLCSPQPSHSAGNNLRDAKSSRDHSCPSGPAHRQEERAGRGTTTGFRG